MPDTRPNADPAELRKFEAIASRWWDPTSEFRPLHEINPLRLEHIDRIAALQGKTVLDVGCGDGSFLQALGERSAIGMDFSILAASDKSTWGSVLWQISAEVDGVLIDDLS